MSPEQAAAWLRDGEAVLLDVREAAELRLAAVEGATHVAMSGLAQRLSELDPAQRYAVLCHHGMRSWRVAAFLLHHGFADVHNVTGGIAAWADTVDARVGRY